MHHHHLLDSAKQQLSDSVDSCSHMIDTALVNLYEENQVKDFITTIKNHSGHIKYLVNSAGFFKPVSFLEHTASDYDMQMEINRAFFFITQAVAKNMQNHRGGSIVNIGSMWAHQAVKATPSSAYSMQKARPSSIAIFDDLVKSV